MVFSSLMFMCIFLPIVLIAYNLSKNLTYKNTVPEPILFKRPVERVKLAAKKQGRDIEVLNKRSIKKYSPGVHHTVVDIRVL